MSGKPAMRHAARGGRSPAQPGGQQDPVTWAAELAATLPPFTERQATAVGRIATQLDTRLNDELAA
jgi:hypothetical protein